MGEKITFQLLKRRAEHNNGDLDTLEEITLHQYDIEKIEAIQDYCKRLKILLLQYNQIMAIENLNKLKLLEYLNLAVNNIRSIGNGLRGCESLQKLDLTMNFIEDLNGVIRDLQSNSELRELYLVGNPCSQEKDYRLRVIKGLSQLKVLDGREITVSERLLACQLSSDYDEEYTIINNRSSHYTPESRLQEARELAEMRSRGRNTAAKEPEKEITIPTFNKETGRIMQRNEGNFDYRFKEDGDWIELSVDVGKYIDASLLSVDLHSNWVSIVVKKESLHLALPEDIMEQSSHAQKSKASGNLVIRMLTRRAYDRLRNRSHANEDLKISKKFESFTGYEVGKTRVTETVSEESNQQTTRRNLLQILESEQARKYLISNQNKNQIMNENFEGEEDEVPPLL